MSGLSAGTKGAGGSSWQPVLGAAIIIALIASVALGLPRTLRHLVDTHRRYAPLDHTTREQAAATHEKFNATDWEFLRRGVRRGDTYLLVTPIGKTGSGVPRRYVTRTFANYRLLPAVQVANRRDANVVVFIDAAAPARATCSTVARTACLLRLRP